MADALDGGRLAGCALDVGRAPDQMPTPALAALYGFESSGNAGK